MNKDRLLEILDHIKKYPDSYNQEVYVSHYNTKYCFAGHALRMFSEPRLTQIELVQLCYKPQLAAAYLNLNKMQANYLFHGDRTMEEIEEYVLFGDTMWELPMDVRRDAVNKALALRYKNEP